MGRSLTKKGNKMKTEERGLHPLQASVSYYYYPDDEDFLEWWEDEKSGYDNDKPTQSDFKFWVETKAPEDFQSERELTRDVEIKQF